MVKEVDWQRKIIKSVRAQGGYGKKWSSTYAVGVPDLILSLPEIGPVFMEVKLFKDLKDGFDRQVDTTAIQREHLGALAAAGARACVGVVEYRGPRDVALCVLPWATRRHADGMAAARVPWVPGVGFDMVKLLT